MPSMTMAMDEMAGRDEEWDWHWRWRTLVALEVGGQWRRRGGGGVAGGIADYAAENTGWRGRSQYPRVISHTFPQFPFCGLRGRGVRRTSTCSASFARLHSRGGVPPRWLRPGVAASPLAIVRFHGCFLVVLSSRCLARCKAPDTRRKLTLRSLRSLRVKPPQSRFARQLPQRGSQTLRSLRSLREFLPPRPPRGGGRKATGVKTSRRRKRRDGRRARTGRGRRAGRARRSS